MKKKIAEIAEESIRISSCAPNGREGSEPAVGHTGTEAAAEETCSGPNGHADDGASTEEQSRDSHQ